MTATTTRTTAPRQVRRAIYDTSQSREVAAMVQRIDDATGWPGPQPTARIVLAVGRDVLLAACMADEGGLLGDELLTMADAEVREYALAQVLDVGTRGIRDVLDSAEYAAGYAGTHSGYFDLLSTRIDGAFRFTP